ncbi:MAG: cytochrome c maturation protein CcmE [Archangium sp.]|nr:cytochrome c maturation protein CcmE [Archangium sp.]MDP3572403.1 cytochrome c maturation protein CcmE [Archangium sp.]
MKPETRNRLIALGAILVAGSALAWIAFGNIGENLVYYWKPSEMVAQGQKAYGATVRLGGVVVPGSVLFNTEHTALTFQVADSHKGDAVKVTVKSEQTPPQMFREGIGVVVEGAFSADQVFRTNRLMVNHSNEYRAPTDGGMPDEAWKNSLTKAE